MQDMELITYTLHSPNREKNITRIIFIAIRNSKACHRKSEPSRYTTLEQRCYNVILMSSAGLETI